MIIMTFEILQESPNWERIREARKRCWKNGADRLSGCKASTNLPLCEKAVSVKCDKEMTTHSISLPGKSHGQRSLVGDGPCGRRESDTTEQLSVSMPVPLEVLLHLWTDHFV